MKNLKIISTAIALLITLSGCGSSSSSTSNAQNNSEYAYITDGTSMKIVDISNPNTPVLKGNVSTASSFKVAVSSGYAYVSEFVGTDPFVNIIDIDDPANPSLIVAIDKGGSFNFGRVSDMYIENNVGYITDEYKGIHIVDLANGVFDVQALAGADAMSVTKKGNDLYLIHQGVAQGIQKFNVSTPYVLTAGVVNTLDVSASSSPGANPIQSRHSIVEHDGTNIIVANRDDKKLKKFDSSLNLLSSVAIAGSANALAVSGNFAYVTMRVGTAPHQADDDAVKMINLTTMTIVDTVTLNQASGVAVFEDKLYVTDSTGLHIYDVSAGSMSLVVDFSQGAGNAIALGQ
jgi:hypothetical protein